MSDNVKSPVELAIRFFASLQLTVACLAIGLVLIFVGTIAQVQIGIDQAVATYFRSLVVWWSPPGASWRVPIMPGGFLVGGVLLVNLIAAHLYRFKWTWKKAGIWLVHVGLIVLLLGELLTAMFSVESYMSIREGQTVSYSEAHRETELAIVDHSRGDRDRVVTIAERALEPGKVYQHANLPFAVEVNGFFGNSQLLRRGGMEAPGTPQATTGAGLSLTAREIPRTGRSDERDASVAWVTLRGTGGPIGTWMLSNLFVNPDFNQPPQTFTFEGKTYSIALRPKRIYRPYSLTLLDFSFDRYPGTEIPKNFSSKVHLRDPGAHEDREVLIYMNHPLRHGGLTYYQASFFRDETGTVLQVVANPSRHLPYISCILVGFGLLVQFAIHLVGFVRRRKDPATSGPEQPQPRDSAPAGWLPWLAFGTAAAIVVAFPFRPEKTQGWDWREFGDLPTLLNGRHKPLDTAARTSLLMISGKQALRLSEPERGKLSAIQWLAELLYAPARADQRKVFLINDPQVLGIFGWQQREHEKYFSFAQIDPGLDELIRQAQLASEVEAPVRNAFQRHVLELYSKVELYQGLKNSLQIATAADFASEVEHLPHAVEPMRVLAAAQTAGPNGAAGEAGDLGFVRQRYARMAQMAQLRVVPPIDPPDAEARLHWDNVGESLVKTLETGAVHPVVTAYAQLGAAYRAGNSAWFDQTLSALAATLRHDYGREMVRAGHESFFNRYQPFYAAMFLFVLAFILGCISWMTGPGVVRRTAFLLAVLGFLVHTSGMAFRVYLQGYAPVTNLYSSALGVGWGAVFLGLALEYFYRNGIGSVVSGVVGFATLIVAHNLAAVSGGDTMEMMRAVLDNNFWLATHVVAITIGYSTMFLAGILALIYILAGVFSRWLGAPASGAVAEKETVGRNFVRMTYGVLCFATFFSFVGTVLGGIWADQSWGRFWGWDPKENGAALIVLWCAIILHARWGGLIRERGLMVMTVFGNIVTAWSWFGVNMLGIGLHSYGFMDKAFVALVSWAVFNLGVMAVGALPLEFWRSFAGAKSGAPLSPPLPKTV